ncbi:hypothetical protein CTI14_68580, partial [Methylobacterium radiotolerans]
RAMIPLRIAAAAVEPVGVPDLRAYLRVDSDAGADEDGLLQALIAAARAMIPLRIAAAAVEPVGVPDLRAYLRVDSDAGA